MVGLDKIRCATCGKIFSVGDPHSHYDNGVSISYDDLVDEIIATHEFSPDSAHANLKNTGSCPKCGGPRYLDEIMRGDASCMFCRLGLKYMRNDY
jgi:hypothetical protein